MSFLLALILATVPASYSPNLYACNGVLATFTIGFPYQTYTDLLVTSTTSGGVVTTLAYSTNYTVNLTSTSSTAVLTLTAPAASCPNTNTLKIARNTSATQPQSFRGQTTYAPDVHEKTYDREMMVIQQLAYTAANPVASNTVSVTAPITGNGSVGTPLAIAKSNTSTDGYLAAVDWTTFNNKAATVTCAANNFVNVIGAVTSTCAQPASTNLSDIPFPETSGGTGNTGITCTNQFTTSNGTTYSCVTPTLAGPQFANQGTTTTVAHGNAAGNPTWSGVSLANDTTANQGTTTTVLHGNAAGQPSFGSVNLGTDTTGTLPATSENVQHDATLTGSGTTGSNLGIDLTHGNTWTGRPTFTPITSGTGATGNGKNDNAAGLTGNGGNGTGVSGGGPGVQGTGGVDNNGVSGGGAGVYGTGGADAAAVQPGAGVVGIGGAGTSEVGGYGGNFLGGASTGNGIAGGTGTTSTGVSGSNASVSGTAGGAGGPAYTVGSTGTGGNGSGSGAGGSGGAALNVPASAVHNGGTGGASGAGGAGGPIFGPWPVGETAGTGGTGGSSSGNGGPGGAVGAFNGGVGGAPGTATGTAGAGGSGIVSNAGNGGATTGAGTGGNGGNGGTFLGGNGGATVGGTGGSGGSGTSATGGNGAANNGAGGSGQIVTGGNGIGSGSNGTAIVAASGSGGTGTASGYVETLTQNNTIKGHLKFSQLAADPSSLEQGSFWSVITGGSVQFKYYTGTATETLLTTGTNNTVIQELRTAGCATAASVGAVCTTTLNWTSSFADTNYTVNCTGELITSGIPLNGGVTSKSVSAVIFQTVAATAAAAQYTKIGCIAVHD